MTKRSTRLSVAVGFAVLLCHSLPSVIVAQDGQLDGSRWTLVAPSSTSLPKAQPPAAFNRTENIISPSGVASYLNDARPALLQTNKFFSSFLVSLLAANVMRTSQSTGYEFMKHLVSMPIRTALIHAKHALIGMHHDQQTAGPLPRCRHLMT